MKKIYLTAFLLFTLQLALACGDGHESSKTTEQNDEFIVYGEAWPTNVSKEISVAEAIENMNGKSEKQLISGKITQVCQKKGCWMIITTGNKFARVDFKNHSFFIPKDSRGFAQVYGVLEAVTLTQEQKEHYESDGATLPTEKIYEISADSVKIFAVDS